MRRLHRPPVQAARPAVRRPAHPETGWDLIRPDGKRKRGQLGKRQGNNPAWDGEGGTPCPQCGEGTQGAGGTVGKTASRRKEPLDVINTCMIPALDHVGKGFEAGTVFLPQLLMSAEAKKSRFRCNQREDGGIRPGQGEEGKNHPGDC